MDEHLTSIHRELGAIKEFMARIDERVIPHMEKVKEHEVRLRDVEIKAAEDRAQTQTHRWIDRLVVSAVLGWFGIKLH